MTVRELRDWLEAAVANDHATDDTEVVACVTESPGQYRVATIEGLVATDTHTGRPAVVVNC